MVMTHTHIKKLLKFKRHSVEKIKWKRTDGQTDTTYFPFIAVDNNRLQ